MGDGPNLSLVGIVVGLGLVLFPEPATTATGLALTTASAGVSLADGGNNAGGGA